MTKKIILLIAIFDFSVHAHAIDPTPSTVESGIERLRQIHQGSPAEEKKANERAETAINKILGEQAERNAESNSVRDTLKAAKNGIAGHFKLQGGIPFPEAETVVLEPSITITEEELAAANGPAMKEYLSNLKVDISRLPRCQRDETTQDRRDGVGSGLLYDVIYLPEDAVPLDPFEVFGAHTEIRKYPLEGDGAIFALMRSSGVPCIPYRIRVTSKAEYHHSGLAAYRNFDKNLDGPGDAHPWAVKRFGIH